MDIKKSIILLIIFITFLFVLQLSFSFIDYKFGNIEEYNAEISRELEVEKIALTDEIKSKKIVESTEEFTSIPSDAKYISESGSDSSGNGSKESPWRSLNYALGKISGGDTLVMREGTYVSCEKSISSSLSGTESKPTVIRGYPREEVYVRCYRNGSEAMAESPETAWEVYNGVEVPNSVKGQVYISKSSFPHKLQYGSTLTYIENGEKKFFLLGYYSKAEHLFSDWEMAPARKEDPNPLHPYSYAGPGYLPKEQPNGSWKILIRLTPSDINVLYPEDAPEGFTTKVLQTTDPRDYQTHFSSSGNIFKISASHMIFQNFTIAGQRVGIESSGTNLNFNNVKFIGFGVIFKEGTDNVVMDKCVFDGGFPDWVVWLDIKASTGAFNNWKTRPVAVTTDGVVKGLTIKNSKFLRHFDGVITSGRTSNLRIINNYMDIEDDAMQLHNSTYDIEFAYNKVIGPGISHQGSSIDTPYPGRKWIHHNIIDASEKKIWGRRIAEGTSHGIGEDHMGWGYHAPIGMHGANSRKDPWKVYNNTIIYGITLSWQYYLGLNRSGSDNSESEFLSSSYNVETMHQEVYNNIFVLVNDRNFYRKYSPINEFFDGNLYHKQGSKPFSIKAFRDMLPGRNYHYSTLDELKSSEYFNISKKYYAPGWENSGIQANPLLDSDYYPAPGSPALIGGVDLSNKNWPGTGKGYIPYRGALKAR